MMLATKLQEAAGNSTQPTYIEDVFSTYLYTGNGSTQTITNGIDLAGKGGLVWIKPRASATTKSHSWWDTFRGATTYVSSNLTNGNISEPNGLTSFNSDGFTIGTNSTVNESGYGVASWTFRKQPKFFDVVTYTGNGSSITVNHNLGSVPGMIIIKNLTNADSWLVWHRSLSGTSPRMFLDATSAAAATLGIESSSVSATSFTYPWSYSTANAAGNNYVAYLFAHNAGGFGLTGTDNVISCGSITTNASTPGVFNNKVTLGWEPQWVLMKNATSSSGWVLIDNMRGITDSETRALYPNSSSAEGSEGANYRLEADGFNFKLNPWGYNQNIIYIAIRRGPMKVPTDGTKVFSPTASSAASGTAITTNFPVDVQIGKYRSGAAASQVVDRLRGISTNTTGAGVSLATSSTAAEVSDAGASLYWDNTGFQMPANLGGISDIFWNFRRAPGFFDEVCYNNPGTYAAQNHNLGVVPELVIMKRRSGSIGMEWYVTGFSSGKYLLLNSNAAVGTTSSVYTTHTSTTFMPFNEGDCVAYLFASCPGVSKVGSYTGNGSTQTINCGFTGGARFVLIKRTDSTGGWYVYDTARGMTTLTDPYLLLNSTAAESATLGSVTTVSTGFAVDASILAAINASGGSYIYFSVA